MKWPILFLLLLTGAEEVLGLSYPRAVGPDQGVLDGVIHVESATNEISVNPPKAPRWACDVRVWTRAPDLSPGAHLPAEARLSINGTDCGDIVKWEVGLRLKERVIVKKK
jgi:hypothetical protein